MPFDAHSNLSFTTVATAPTPADTGVTLTVAAGTGSRFPAVPFNATIWDGTTLPDPTTAEIVRVTARSGDDLTIVRAQESSSARTVVAGDYIAAAVTKKTLTDIEDAISAVSSLVSVESAARVAGDAALSEQVSVVSNAASNALSAGLLALSLITTNVSQAISAVSNAASIADAHAGAASAAATSVFNAIQAVSARTTAGVSVKGVQSAINALSSRISALGAGGGSVTSAEVQVASAAATSVDARVNTVSNLLSALTSAHNALSNAVSDSISIGASVLDRLSNFQSAISAVSARTTGLVSVRGVQAALNGLSARISALGAGGGSVTSAEVQVASAAATSADAHAAAASAAATSVDARVNTVSNLVSALTSAHNALSNVLSGVSVQSVGGTSVKGLQSALNALSGRISDLLSTQNALSNTISDALSAGNVASNTLSALKSAVSNVSATSAGGGSATGLQAVIDALSNKISSVGGGSGSVTSNELSTLTSAHNALSNVVSNALSAGDVASNKISALSATLAGGSARTTAGTSVKGYQSVINALSSRISALGAGGGSVTSAEVQTASAAATSADAHAATASAAATSADAHAAAASAAATSVLAYISAASVRTTANASVRGLQSAFDALSNRISALTGGAGSVTSTELSNVLSVANAASNAASVADVHASTASAAATSADAHANAASAAATSVDSRVASILVALSALSVRSVGGVSTHGLQSVLDALSNRISAGGGGAGSVTSTELSAAIASVLAIHDTLSNVVSNALSAGDVVSNQLSALSALVVSGLASVETHASAASAAATSVDTRVTNLIPWLAGVQRIVSDTQSTTASALTDVSGMVLTVAAGETWKIEGQALISTSAATQGLRMGWSVPPLSTPRFGTFVFVSNQQSALPSGGGGQLQVSGSSTLLSITSVAPAGGTQVVNFAAILNVASAGTVRLKFAGIASTVASPIQLLAGTHMLCFRLK